MPLQIFVEDKLNEAYEILAAKALGLPAAPINRRQVRASIIDPDDLTAPDRLLDLVSKSQAAGFDCVMFIMDEEALPASPDRTAKLRDFRQAFAELCRRLESLSDEHALRTVQVIRVVAKRCLESWLLSDPQAIVRAVSGSRGISYTPSAHATEDVTPSAAAEQIAHIIREVGKRSGRRDLQQVRSGSIKSRGKAIAQYVDVTRARHNNRSLAYFFDMANCQQSGCLQPCPE